jgi:hypothetical protein
MTHVLNALAALAFFLVGGGLLAVAAAPLVMVFAGLYAVPALLGGIVACLGGMCLLMAVDR